MQLYKALTGPGAASWGYCSAPGSAELTQLFACFSACSGEANCRQVRAFLLSGDILPWENGLQDLSGSAG